MKTGVSPQPDSGSTWVLTGLGNCLKSFEDEFSALISVHVRGSIYL